MKGRFLTLLAHSKRIKKLSIAKVLQDECTRHKCLYAARYNIHLVLKELDSRILSKVVIYQYTDEWDLLQLLFDSKISGFDMILMDLSLSPTITFQQMLNFLGACLRAAAEVLKIGIVCVTEDRILVETLKVWAHEIVEVDSPGGLKPWSSQH